MLSIGDQTHISDPRFLIAKKPLDNVSDYNVTSNPTGLYYAGLAAEDSVSELL